MVAKVKRNDWGDCIYDEQTLIDEIYHNPDLDIGQLCVESPAQYLSALKELDIDLPIIQAEPVHTESVENFDRALQSQWYMPEQYQKINVLNYLLERCQNTAERERVQNEYVLFEKKGFVQVLQFLIYFIDTLRENNIVWGVGRGSSVSSFCLFLIGVHKINPLLYNLDYKEFLR
jgi:DNA polymerase III alpha subunit